MKQFIMPVTGKVTEVTEEVWETLRARVVSGAYPKCPVAGEESAWEAGWRSLVRVAPSRYPTIEVLRTRTCKRCSSPWGTGLIPTGAAGGIHLVGGYKACVCQGWLDHVSHLRAIAPELETALVPADGYVTPLRDSTTMTVVAVPDAFYRDLRITLATRNWRAWSCNILTDAELTEMARPKPFARGGDTFGAGGSGSEDDPEAGMRKAIRSASESYTSESVHTAVTPWSLLIIRVGYDPTTQKVDLVHQAVLARAGKNLPTWIWHDQTTKWDARPTLQAYLNLPQHPSVKVTL